MKIDVQIGHFVIFNFIINILLFDYKTLPKLCRKLLYWMFEKLQVSKFSCCYQESQYVHTTLILFSLFCHVGNQNFLTMCRRVYHFRFYKTLFLQDWRMWLYIIILFLPAELITNRKFVCLLNIRRSSFKLITLL